MSATIQQRIITLIRDTNSVFQNCGGVNTDYADFATIALAEFKTLLGTPKLTDRELKQLIRKANVQHKATAERDNCNTEDCWATFIADHITQQANSNKQFQQV